MPQWVWSKYLNIDNLIEFTIRSHTHTCIYIELGIPKFLTQKAILRGSFCDKKSFSDEILLMFNIHKDSLVDLETYATISVKYGHKGDLKRNLFYINPIST